MRLVCNLDNRPLTQAAWSARQLLAAARLSERVHISPVLDAEYAQACSQATPTEATHLAALWLLRGKAALVALKQLPVDARRGLRDAAWTQLWRRLLSPQAARLCGPDALYAGGVAVPQSAYRTLLHETWAHVAKASSLTDVDLAPLSKLWAQLDRTDAKACASGLYLAATVHASAPLAAAGDAATHIWPSVSAAFKDAVWPLPHVLHLVMHVQGAMTHLSWPVLRDVLVRAQSTCDAQDARWRGPSRKRPSNKVMRCATCVRRYANPGLTALSKTLRSMPLCCARLGRAVRRLWRPSSSLLCMPIAMGIDMSQTCWRRRKRLPAWCNTLGPPSKRRAKTALRRRSMPSDASGRCLRRPKRCEPQVLWRRSKAF